MDAKNSSLLSVGIHLLLLLGLAVMAVEHLAYGDGDGPGLGSGFSCTVGGPRASFDRIDRPKDILGARVPSADGPAAAEVFAPPGTFSTGDDEGEGDI